MVSMGECARGLSVGGLGLLLPAPMVRCAMPVAGVQMSWSNSCTAMTSALWRLRT